MDILEKIHQLLREHADEKTKTGSQHFFKEEIVCYGVKTPIVHKISKATFPEIKNRPKAEIWELCEELWKSGYTEESYVACNWSYELRKQYEPEDFKLFEKWVDDYVSNWASCDSLCNHSIGTFLEMYPQFVTELKRWTTSANRWKKRAAAVSLILPARKGLFLSDVFEIADILLLDPDDLVQKGYGWMLKEAGRTHQQEIFDYIMSKKSIMPRTSLRYAIEKMPAELKKEAMKKE